jgi:hypothetical protein
VVAETSSAPVRKTRRSRAAEIATIYASNRVVVRAPDSGSVAVDVSLDPSDIEAVRRVVAEVIHGDGRITERSAARKPAEVMKSLAGLMKGLVGDMLEHRFAQEVDKVVDAYRVRLHESLAKGDDPKLRAALNQARLQERILASVPMVDQAQACELLGLSQANPSATMKRKEDKLEILRFMEEGRVAYPLFQFDVEGRRLYPAIAKLIAQKPVHWSDFRLLHWLTRPHLDFESRPAEALADEDSVLDAFRREIAPAAHG